MTFQFLVDWANNGNFVDVGDDITDDIRPLINPVGVQYGRDTGPDAALTAGSGGFTVDNATRKYSKRNTASVLYGRLLPGRPVKITRTVDGTTYTLFRGRTDSTPLNPSLDSQTVGVSLVDYLADFRNRTITTRLHSAIRTGKAIGWILDDAGWTGGRDIDPGATVIPWWWEDGTDALTALDKLVRSEGFPALLTVGPSGEIVFRDRHHRLLDANSTTSQATWRGDGAYGATVNDFSYDDAWGNIVNSATISVDIRRPQPLQQVWSSDLTYTLSVGEQQVITASGTDPFFGAVAPVAGVDYTMKAGSITTRLLNTSGSSVGIVITAIGGTAVVTGMQLRAQPVTVQNTTPVSASDSQSIANYGARTFTGDLPWCGVYDAQAIISQVVAQRANPLATVTAKLMADSFAMPRDLSDRVTLVEQETGLADDFFIESIQHDATSEMDHTITFALEAAPTGVSTPLRFDTSGAGFDQGKFGSGLTESSNMFLFDSTTSGHRFNEGVFAA